MIIEWLMGLAAGFMEWLAGIFPEWDVPEWLTDIHGPISTLLDGMAGFGVWVDWTVLGIVIGGVLTAWLVTLVVKGLRWVVGLFPTMGGGQ